MNQPAAVEAVILLVLGRKDPVEGDTLAKV